MLGARALFEVRLVAGQRMTPYAQLMHWASHFVVGLLKEHAKICGASRNDGIQVVPEFTHSHGYRSMSAIVLAHCTERHRRCARDVSKLQARVELFQATIQYCMGCFFHSFRVHGTHSQLSLILVLWLSKRMVLCNRTPFAVVHYIWRRGSM